MIGICEVKGIRLTLHCSEDERKQLTRYFYNNNVFIRTKSIFKSFVCNEHETYSFCLPLNWEFLVAIVNELKLSVDDDFKFLLNTINEKKVAIDYIKNEWKNDDYVPVIKELRPYQNQGVDFIQTFKSICLFWEQRTGKTPTTIKAIENKDKIIIAIPAGHLFNWYDEWKKWSKRTDIVINNLSKAKRLHIYKDFNDADKQIMIISYKTLANDMRNNKNLLKNYDYLVVDEAHFLRNDTTQQSKGLMKARLLANDCLLLTGTPSVNSTSDAIPLLKFCRINDFYEKWFIQYYFFEPKNVFFSNYPQFLDVLEKRNSAWAELLDNMCFMLKLKDVMKWIPKEIVVNERIEATPKQKKYLQQMLTTFSVKNDKEKRIYRAPNVLVQLLRLNQLSIDPNILDLDEIGAKTLWLKDYLNEEENLNKTFIIWSDSAKYITFLKENIFKDASIITGALNAQEKHQQSEMYKNGKTRILLCTIGAGATGWTWDNTDTMIFVNRSWSMVDNAQAIKRGTPTIKENVRKTPLMIIDLYLNEGIDDYVNGALLHKWNQTEMTRNFPAYVNKVLGVEND